MTAYIIKKTTEILIRLGLRDLSISWSSTSFRQGHHLAELVRGCGARLIGEVGFNGGFSSFAFLKANPDARVISFDLGEYEYVAPAKERIDKEFPGRHTLVYGDSKKTIPIFAKDHPDIRFDFVFIDGGHDYESPRADIANLRKLSREGTVVVMDDVIPWVFWGMGPARAWKEAVKGNVVMQEGVFRDGIRTWAVGKYI